MTLSHTHSHLCQSRSFFLSFLLEGEKAYNKVTVNHWKGKTEQKKGHNNNKLNNNQLKKHSDRPIRCSYGVYRVCVNCLGCKLSFDHSIGHVLWVRRYVLVSFCVLEKIKVIHWEIKMEERRGRSRRNISSRNGHLEHMESYMHCSICHIPQWSRSSQPDLFCRPCQNLCLPPGPEHLHNPSLTLEKL